MIFDFLFRKKLSDAELGEAIGEIIHYFPHVKAGVIKIHKGTLSVGDKIYIKGHTTNFEEKIKTMQVNHQSIDKATKGHEAGINVRGRVRKGDKVYKI